MTTDTLFHTAEYLCKLYFHCSHHNVQKYRFFPFTKSAAAEKQFFEHDRKKRCSKSVSPINREIPASEQTPMELFVPRIYSMEMFRLYLAKKKLPAVAKNNSEYYTEGKELQYGEEWAVSKVKFT